MIEKWKADFAAHGLQRDKKAFVKDADKSIRQAIWETKDKYGKNEFLITLAICMNDRFKQPEDGFVCLSASPKENGIMMHDTMEQTKWWIEPEIEKAKTATFKDGLQWLDEYSSLDKLISYYENCLTEGILPPQTEPNGIVGKIWQQMAKGKNSGKPRRPPAFHHYLGLIYHEKGDLANAGLHANRYLFHLKEMRLPCEPERTLRLLDASGCKLHELEYCDQCGKR